MRTLKVIIDFNKQSNVGSGQEAQAIETIVTGFQGKAEWRGETKLRCDLRPGT